MDTPTFLRKFPRLATLNDGQPATIRPLRPNGDSALHQFFVKVPEEDRFYPTKLHRRGTRYAYGHHRSNEGMRTLFSKKKP